MRRRIRADGIARRQARLSAHQAALPRRRGTVWLPHGYQQRRDVERRAFDYPRRRRSLRQSWHAPQRRHAPPVRLRSRPEARHVRNPSRNEHEEVYLRSGRWNRRRKKTESGDSRRKLLRSEERRVGKESRSRGTPSRYKKREMENVS